MFKDKILMITGGTGSFGNAVVKRLINTDIGEIRIFSRDEKKQQDMRASLNNHKCKFYIGDVRDIRSINKAIKGVDYVFHAAALKQVPSCEFHPMEAVNTNILGTENLVESAIYNGVKRVVVLSTDKAVYPLNAMGLSKALMEKIVVARAGSLSADETILNATRYGNVMGSRGSVIPLFISQIRSGGPITVTDPDMSRFLMSLEESVKLVLHAFEHGEQGDIFVQKAPGTKISVLVEALNELFNSACPVEIIGVRHGEKLFETLLSQEELMRAIEMENFYRLPADNRSLNYNKYFTEGNIRIAKQEDFTSQNTIQLNCGEVKELLKRSGVLKINADM